MDVFSLFFSIVEACEKNIDLGNGDQVLEAYGAPAEIKVCKDACLE